MKPTVVVMLLLVVATAWGQHRLQDPEAYRKAKAEATRIFLDSNQSKETRLKALNDIGYPDDETFRGVLAILANPREDDDIRTGAARLHRMDDTFIAAVLVILGDPRNGGESLKANLVADLSRRAIPRLRPAQRTEVQNAIRVLLDDPREAVRVSAFRALVPSEDSAATERLANSLRPGGTPAIPPADAIDLLDMVGAVNYLTVLRPYLDHPDAAVRASAARTLAIDPESRAKIVAMVRNKQTPSAVRTAALKGLVRPDEAFTTYAVPLLDDAEEPVELRLLAMKSLVGRINYKPTPPNVQVEIAGAIERFSKAPRMVGPADAVQAARDEAAKTLRHLQETVPAVRDHYSRPR